MKTSALLMSKNPGNKFRGLLLFEVAVAIAIISVGLVFILRSFSTTLNALKTATKYYQGVLLLENKAWDLKVLALNEKNLEEVPLQEGDFSQPYQNFHWSIQKEPVKDTELNQVNLSVSWPQNKGRNSVSIVTYEYGK
mgnify:FL=1